MPSFNNSGHPGDETSHFIVEIAQLRRELIVAQEQITELQSRNAALEKELRLARHQLRKGGASGEQYSHVSSRSPGGIAANRRSCPGGPVALVLREPEGRIRAGAAEKIVWTRVNGRMVPVMKDESMEPGPLPRRYDEAATQEETGQDGEPSQSSQKVEVPARERPLLAENAESLSQVELDGFLSSQFEGMSYGSGDVSGQYSAFSNGIITDYLRYVTESGDRSRVAAVLHSLSQITAVKSPPSGQFMAHIQKGLSRGNKRKHKSISWALNLFCVHLDICRMLYLLKELDDQSLAAACEKEWNSAAELYHRVAVHMEDLHHAVLLGKGEDANTVQDDPEWQDISPDIPPTPCEFLERFVLPHCLWQIPFVELQRRCLQYLDFDVDDEIMDRLWSRAGNLPDKQREDRRDVARKRAENSIVEGDEPVQGDAASDEPDDPNPPRKSRKSIEEAVQDEMVRRRKTASVKETATESSSFIGKPQADRARRMERYHRKPKGPNIEVRQHVPGGSFYDEYGHFGNSFFAHEDQSLSPLAGRIRLSAEAFEPPAIEFGPSSSLISPAHCDTALLPAVPAEAPKRVSPARRPRVLVPATPLTIERRRGEMAANHGWLGSAAFGRGTPTEHSRRLFTPVGSMSGSRGLFSPGDVPQLPALPLEATMALLEMTTPTPATRNKRSMLRSRSISKCSARKSQEPAPINLAAKVLLSPLATVPEECPDEQEQSSVPASSPEDSVASGAPSVNAPMGPGLAFEIIESPRRQRRKRRSEAFTASSVDYFGGCEEALPNGSKRMKTAL